METGLLYIIYICQQKTKDPSTGGYAVISPPPVSKVMRGGKVLLCKVVGEEDRGWGACAPPAAAARRGRAPGEGLTKYILEEKPWLT
jgi:hypothetical protein